MAGLYPNSPHVKELERILYNKENPVTNEHCRWSFSHPEVKDHVGKVPGLDRFDGQFFKVHYRLGNAMDSMGRKILEQAYQAIYDAGVSPEHLSGKKVGVYTGSCFSETEKACFYVASSRTGFGIAGCSKTMFANRISYWLNAKGPSMSIDEACCSSIAALEQAYLAITRGECEAAIVGGCNLCLHPQSSVHYGRIMTLCSDGKTKSFDANADGIAKSEAVNVLFLQRAKDAKRIYAEVLHVKSEFRGILKKETGDPKFGFYRDPADVADFLKQFYDEAKVPPQAVEYVEAFGSAVPEADKSELEAIDKVFCENRQDPLLVGSVMSNIGYGEAASGISAITKVLLGYQKGSLAGNLHCESPRRDVAALRDGRMQIVTEQRGFGRSYTAVNGISVTGVNAHVLLHGHYKPKDPNRYKSTIPRLLTISGRQDTAVRKILDDLKTRPIDPEEHALFHNIHQHRVSGHMGRGYVILDTDEAGKTVALAETVSYFDDSKRPLWFVYSGMGSQWAGMGAQLMRIPVFAAAIDRCRKALEPKGIDIVHIITSPDKTIFDNILHSFVGIAAIQIGLTDVLTSLGIVPDKIIGHSVGELGCAYADGCFTAEEMILSAYSRGLVSVQTPFIRGSMAAVGIGYQQIRELMPPEIEVACHNGPESSTISGPADKMKEFVAELTAKGIFAKEVPCSNIAYHSRYIAEAGPGLLKYLSEVIKEPKLRSERWVSSSVPQEQWGKEEAKYSSAYYHTNNLLSSVLFEETSRLIPANAVTLEIAPHGLLQAILKRSLPESCKHIALTRRGHHDNAFMVLDAVGKLYMEGYLPKVQALYPPVQFPVSTGTPMLSHLVEWAHAETWTLPLYVSAHRKQAASCKFVITTHDEEHSFLQGNVIRGKNLYPLAAALVAVWDTLAMSLNKKCKQISAEFRDVHLYAQPPLLQHAPLRLNVALHRVNGRFEVLNEELTLVEGFIHDTFQDAVRTFDFPFEPNENLDLTCDDVYQMLYERDYFYRGDFRSIHKINKSLTEAEIVWNDNWVTFLDGVLQLNALRTKHDTVAQPSHIRRICIDINKHSGRKFFETDGKIVASAQVFDYNKAIRCGGVVMENIQSHNLPILEEDAVLLKSVNFFPRFQAYIDVPVALQVYLQMVAENVNKDKINVLGIINNKEDSTIYRNIRSLIDNIPGVTINYEQTKLEKVLQFRDTFLNEVDLVLVLNLSGDEHLCQILYRVLPRDIFLINAEKTFEDRIRPSALYRVLSSYNINNTKLELLKWRPTQINTASTVVTVRHRSELSLLNETRNELPQRHKLVILSSYPPLPELKDLVRSWRKEAHKNQIYLVMVSDKDNLDQLPELDLPYGVLIDGVWGGEYIISSCVQVSAQRGVTLRSSHLGDLDALHWVEADEIGSANGIPVTVHYAGINDLDVKRALGVIPVKNDNSPYAMDFSGITDSGLHVMGVVEGGAASGRVAAHAEMLWPVPAHWSLEDAATVPLAYAHAFYILDSKVQLRRRDTCLVHGAAGALGQALVSILLAHDCEVFATVSDPRKKRFLLKLFPQLKEDHIGNSRDRSFCDMVLSQTRGKGCHFAISCLKSDLKNINIKCISVFGMLIDTVQVPNQENYSFGMFNLTKERNYCPIDFSSIFTHNKVQEMRRLQVLVSEGIARGYVRPLSRVTYSPEEVSRAFRLLASSRHRGRVLIRLQDKVTVVEPRVNCSSHLCQVVLYDEQTFGLQFVERLVSRGAKYLRLHCNSLSRNLQMKMQSWEDQNVKIQVSSEDLTNNKNLVRFLSESNCLAPVEGIYIIAADPKNETVEKVTTIIANLDLASRKLCPSLKYFAVINSKLSIGQQTCMSRENDGLPGTILSIPALRKLDDTDPTLAAISWRSAVNAAEKAIRSPRGRFVACSTNAVKLTLLQEIANIADLEIPEDVVEMVTLLDLGIDMTKVPVISAFLRDTHSIAVSEESIPHMTVQRIRELHDVIHGEEVKEVSGLSSFFAFVDPDELLATTEFVILPTLINNSTMRDDEFNVNQTHLCIIPGLEGHHNRFQTLCERLKLPALVLQPGLDFPSETVSETAHRYAEILLNKVCLHNNFYLLGFESGVAVALEVANILEENGLTGTVFCLGGTPEEFQTLLEEHLSDIPDDEALQDAVASHMFTLMTGQTEGIKKALREVSSWKQKVEVCVRMLLGRVPHSAQYAKNLMDAAYSRIRTARSHKMQPKKLKSKLVLLHASSLHSELPPGASLQSYSQHPIAVHQLQEPLTRATQDLRCSAIINNYLDPEIIQVYEEKNLCDTYLLNRDTFMVNALELPESK